MKFREATENDLVEIVKLLANDNLGKPREIVTNPVAQSYLTAFNEISKDPNNRLYVAVNESKIVGTVQLTIIPTFCRTGAKRAQIEGVRAEGIGDEFMDYVLQKAKEAGCEIVQLTTDKTRMHAHDFYLRKGFVDSHIGTKKEL